MEGQEQLSGLSREEIERSVRAIVKSLHCPACDERYTDSAVDWSAAWLEGRTDLAREFGRQERDGPLKLKCEWCGERAWFDFFSRTVRGDTGRTP